MDRINVIQLIINKLKGKLYLEIGVGGGGSFFFVRAKEKIGVDPEFCFNRKLYLKYRLLGKLSGLRERFFRMTSDEFFLKRSHLFGKQKIDVGFVDGLHTYQQSLRDVFNCLQYLKENGVIVIHDCSPQSEIMAYPAPSKEVAIKMGLLGWSDDWCGDVWKTIVNLRSTRNDLRVFTLDCDYGVGVVTKGRAEGMLDFSAEDIEKLTYADFDQQRDLFLNLKPVSYLDDFLKSL